MSLLLIPVILFAFFGLALVALIVGIAKASRSGLGRAGGPMPLTDDGFTSSPPPLIGADPFDNSAHSEAHRHGVHEPAADTNTSFPDSSPCPPCDCSSPSSDSCSPSSSDSTGN